MSCIYDISFFLYLFLFTLFSFSSLCPDSPAPHHTKHILFLQPPLNRFHVSFQSQEEVESWHVLSHVGASLLREEVMAKLGPDTGLTIGYRVFVRREGL